MIANATDLELPSAEELHHDDTASPAANAEAAAAVEAGDEVPASEEVAQEVSQEVAAQAETPVPEKPKPPLVQYIPLESKAADRLEEIKRARREVAARKAEYFEAKEIAKEAKKDWESARNRLEKIIDGERPAPILDAIEAANDVKGEAEKAAKTKAKRKADQADGAGAEGGADQPSSPDAWRSVPIEQLGLPPKLVEKLKEAAVDTIGQLEDLRASRAHGDGLRSIKGIGKTKADAIEDAVISWLSRTRDKVALAEAGTK